MCLFRGTLLASEGRIYTPASVLTMPRKWAPWVTQTSRQHRAAHSLARKPWKIPWIFFVLKNGSACGPGIAFFTKFSHIFHSGSHDFPTIFHDFRTFSQFFSHIFPHVWLCAFLKTFFRDVLPKVFFIVCNLHTAQPSARQVMPLLVDQARHSWPNTHTKQSFKRQVFGKIRSKSSLWRQSAITQGASFLRGISDFGTQTFFRPVNVFAPMVFFFGIFLGICLL